MVLPPFFKKKDMEQSESTYEIALRLNNELHEARMERNTEHYKATLMETALKQISKSNESLEWMKIYSEEILNTISNVGTTEER